jgi:hypothetical protein
MAATAAAIKVFPRMFNFLTADAPQLTPVCPPPTNCPAGLEFSETGG